jgi:Glycosyl transferases group 1
MRTPSVKLAGKYVARALDFCNPAGSEVLLLTLVRKQSSREASPRVLIWSPRGYDRNLWRCGQFEFEDVVREIDDVDLVAPTALERGQGFAARRLREVSQRLAKVDFHFQDVPPQTRLTRDYDLFFFYAQNLNDLHLLKRLPDWRSRARKAVCLLEELWIKDLEHGRVPRQLRKFDALVVNFHGSVERLQEVTKLPCTWVPAGVDALRFFPGIPAPARSIDIFGMGRRSDVAHSALSAHASEHGWTYLFDTVDPARVRDSASAHRVQLAELVKRTRYFVVNKARVDTPWMTAGQDEVAFRSFEGAAAGAVMIGDSPQAPYVEQLFDWPDAHVRVPHDSPDITAVIASLEQDPQRVQRIRRDNVLHSLRRHDWAYRWQAILELAGLPAHERLQARLARLEQCAQGVEATSLDVGALARLGR